MKRTQKMKLNSNIFLTNLVPPPLIFFPKNNSFIPWNTYSSASPARCFVLVQLKGISWILSYLLISFNLTLIPILFARKFKTISSQSLHGLKTHPQPTSELEGNKQLLQNLSFSNPKVGFC